MNKINYQKILDETLRQIAKEDRTPTLLLHSCCAPCSSYTLEYLMKYFDVTLLYYNPNIYPPQEFSVRLDEQRRLIEAYNNEKEGGKIKMIAGKYEPKEFYDIAKGLENEPEKGARCLKCYELRLRAAAKAALDINADYFTTTLTISPLKDAETINLIGKRISEEYGVKYLYSDFKKKNGYKRSIELSAKYSLYRQNYCGCVYSLKNAQNQAEAD